ncbi:MAG TPA: hypothetical protein VK708_00740 [Bryobacteraceae bacterium]|nr:hypothetical protein [Bryobacteraceae bacterium]
MAQVGRRAQQELPKPPVPSDPLELVTGNAQPVQDVSHRAEIVNLLEDAHQRSNVRAQAYDLKTTFTVSGSLSSGVWQEEDMSPAKKLYRWNIQGPGYSAVNMNVNRVFYSSQPSGALPLRLLQFREAIFYTAPVVGPHAAIRTANASLNGVDLVCALIVHNAVTPTATGGRRWEEEEYCVDPKAGTLITYSPAPGYYVLYDYSKALQFHGKQIANAFTISLAGQTVIEAQTESITDPVNNPAAFQTAGLNQIGVGPVMTPAWRSRVGMPSTVQSATSQMVVLHGMQAPSGQVSDVELLASSDASLNEAALAFASKWQGRMMGQDAEDGVTPQSHEVVMTIEYSSPQPAAPAE